MDSVIRYLVMLNSSVNFIIYCFVGSRFRNSLKEIFFPKNDSISGDLRERHPSLETNNQVLETLPMTTIYKFREVESVSTVLDTENNSSKNTFSNKVEVSRI